jgi:glucose/arabinose dehydrogenase
MRRLLYLCFLCVGMLSVVSPVFSQTLTPPDVVRQTLITGLNQPVGIFNCGDDRLFVIEQNDGDILIIDRFTGANIGTFLDVTGLINTGGERGLLGMAFHPNYAENGYFYLNYTGPLGITTIARYKVSASNPNVADPSSAAIILTVPQPYANHNGGCIDFGPDGYLYIGMGDGGGGGDPLNSGQDPSSLLGKMLRIDVDGGFPYVVPADNPFVGVSGYAPEIWALGLRNPWRWSFDALTGDLWMGDVGQNIWEEINKQPAGVSGLNYGWRCYEGDAIYNTSGCQDMSTYAFPVSDYSHAQGWASITGGIVHRGTRYPGLNGWYLFSDYGHGDIYAMKADGSTGYATEFWELSNTGTVSFGTDVEGEMYMVNITGTIWRIVDACGDFYPQLSNNEAGGLEVTGGAANQYWWYKDGVQIDGAAGASYLPVAPGSYYAIANNGTCTRQTQSVQWITVSGIGGCTYANAQNYDPLAGVDDGSCTFGTPADCPGDLDGNGFINVQDLAAFLQVFGGNCQ